MNAMLIACLILSCNLLQKNVLAMESATTEINASKNDTYIPDPRLKFSPEGGHRSLADINGAFREVPYKYLQATLGMFNAKHGLNPSAIIVEIGTSRDPFPRQYNNAEFPNHQSYDVTQGFCGYCLGGHSTLWWAGSKAQVYSVDICPEACRLAGETCAPLKNVRIIEADGIAFLQSFKKTIDLLFLDAWDVRPDIAYAEEHLRAYEAAKDKLVSGSMILIDDTDIEEGGKGKLVIPQAIKDGWTVVFNGRQTLLVKN